MPTKTTKRDGVVTIKKLPVVKPRKQKKLPVTHGVPLEVVENTLDTNTDKKE